MAENETPIRIQWQLLDFIVRTPWT